MTRKQYRRQFMIAATFAILFTLGLLAMGGCETTRALFNGVGNTLEALGGDLQRASNAINTDEPRIH